RPPPRRDRLEPGAGADLAAPAVRVAGRRYAERVMDEIALQPYREYHARRERELLARKEALRFDVLAQARAAIRRLAPDFPALRAVYLFGSILKIGRFHSSSDVDVAIDCADLETEHPFWGALEDALERNVVLLPRVGRVAQAVEVSGEPVYEREVSGS